MFPKSGFYFIALFLLAIIGFWQSYFSQLFDDIDGYVHFHAVTMLFWIILLITQAFIIRNKKYPLHRFVGKISYVLVPLIIISLILLAHNQIVIREDGISFSRLYILFLQLSLLAIFIIAYVLAIVYRKHPAYHARYMISTALTLIDPAVARIPIDIPVLLFSFQVITFTLTDLIFIILIIMERKQKQGREVFPIMLAIFLIFQGLNLTWTDSSLWSRFATWFAILPLT